MFRVTKNSKTTKARLATLETAHGNLKTPFFMTIATKGAVKALAVSDLKRLGVPIVLSNTYHLLVKPGMDAMRRVGGLHEFMGWNGPILTDSGGYQGFSLDAMRKVTEDGVFFQSHIDGRKISLTVEESVAMQQAIGSDIMMQLDVVEAPKAPKSVIEVAMERSVRWAKRAKTYLEEHCGGSIIPNGKRQMLFGIVQGGIYEDLRKRSAESLINLDLDGYAIGGLSVGESREDNLRVAEFTANLLPKNKPRYFMGGGMPEEIVAYVQMGIDMFDCVIPTRHARHGSLFVWNGEPTPERLLKGDFYEEQNIKNAVHAYDNSPIDEFSDAPLSLSHSRAYLHHLFDTQEPLAIRIATENNVRFYMRLMEILRVGVQNGII